MAELANVKYLFNKKYERQDSIIDKITITTEVTEKNPILSVINEVKMQYARIIIWPAGEFKINLPSLYLVYLF